MTLEQMGINAKKAGGELARLDSGAKNRALTAIANAFIENSQEIIRENQFDVKNARENGLSESYIDRLTLTPARIEDMANGVRYIVTLNDPVGEVLEGHVTGEGLNIRKVRVPLGVIGIIYESRPNVTADAAALCLKAGNACILRGGKEAINSNKIIAGIMRAAVSGAGLPADCIQLVEDTSRETATGLMKLSKYLDVLIPRGGAGLIRSVVENSTVPVIETGTGNCHIYVEKTADIGMAANIVFNAKTSRPSVCNAAETLLVDESIAADALPVIKARLDEKNVELRCCEQSRQILGVDVKSASDEDYYTEFLDYILAVKVVESVSEAIEHIAKYSSGHSESIITNDFAASQRFVKEVDSTSVYVNASTRFTDGGVFGLGAEIGISTQKLHARGPMGLRELTSCKYIINGSGQIR